MDNLAVTEVNYHPAPPPAGSVYNTDDFQFIELKNTSSQTIDLTDVELTLGYQVAFDFTGSAVTTLAPGEYVLIAENQDALISLYGSQIAAQIAGEYSGELAHGSERICLRDYLSQTIADFTYSDNGTWPVEADGGGCSLQLISTAALSYDPSNWIAAVPTPGESTVAMIAGRLIFYNNSKFDSHQGFPNGDPGANDYDDGAVATDKTALLPGHTATLANYTSYSRGINGIMVDIYNLTNPDAISAADFLFKVGNGGAWTTVPASPSNVLVRQGKGVGGSYRVTITWADNVIQNQWLQVTVLADANTGLAATDVFYFGNAIGESGNSPANAVVDTADETGSRTHKTGFTAAAVDNHYDYNRDGRVNATDDLIARHNRTDGVGGNPLQLITLTPAIVGRYVFYNDSIFDGHTGHIDGDPAANIYDDNSIATDKQALLPGLTATFDNYTSYSLGINGIMIDVLYSENPGGITAADFQFKVGNGGAGPPSPCRRATF